MGATVASSPISLQSANAKVQNPKETVRVGVLGASGYTGAEVHSSFPFSLNEQVYSSIYSPAHILFQ